MKRALLFLLVLSFGGLWFSKVALAAAPASPSGGLTPTPIAVPSLVSTPTVDYALPYPGILPDSPLYFLKVIRDQVTLWLVRDPGQNAFYLLLLSDKRLAAGQVLVNTGKVGIGVTTVSKGEDYYRRAVEGALSLPKTNSSRSDLLAKLVVSGMKHQEIIRSLLSKTSGQDKLSLTKSLEVNLNAQNRVIKVSITNSP